MRETGPIQLALGNKWGRLHPTLQRHYLVPAACEMTERGHLDIDYPTWMHPIMIVLGLFGILVDQRGRSIPTKVTKWNDGMHPSRIVNIQMSPFGHFTSCEHQVVPLQRRM